MTHPFTDHTSRPRQLVKHPRAVRQLATGEIDAAELARKPWYLRLQFAGADRLKSLGTADTREALRLAKGLLRDADGDNNKLANLLDESSKRSQLTCASVAKPYRDAGYPDHDGRPRGGRALRDEKLHLKNALEYFGPRHPAHLTRADQQDFLAHVRGRVSARYSGTQLHSANHTGLRTAELDLVSLSNCLEWAITRGLTKVNPLVGRRRFRGADDIAHHRYYQPQNSDELHNLARWLWEAGHHTAAARLLFHALTGQRPGEAVPLRWHHPGMMEGTPGYRGLGLPITLGYLGAGDATPRIQHLHVHREKGGINPAVIVHPALEAMLGAWRSWCESQSETGCVGGEPMFPGSVADRADLSELLNEAAVALGSPKNRFGKVRRTSHSLRAFYVSVRRSQGAPDVMIATELGQGSGAQMVRTYGAATDIFGSGRIHWMPSDGRPPAWELFRAADRSQVVPFAPTSAAG